MSTPYPQQPAGQPAVPAQPVQPAQPVGQAPQVAPQVGLPAQPAGQAPQVAPQVGLPTQPAGQGYSTAPQGFAPGYVPMPQGPVKVRVNYLSRLWNLCMGAHRTVSAGRVEIDALAGCVRERGGYCRLLSSFCAGLRRSVEPHRCHRRFLKGEGEAGEMEVQQAGDYPQCDPLHYLFRLFRSYVHCRDCGSLFVVGRWRTPNDGACLFLTRPPLRSLGGE